MERASLKRHFTDEKSDWPGGSPQSILLVTRQVGTLRLQRPQESAAEKGTIHPHARLSKTPLYLIHKRSTSEPRVTPVGLDPGWPLTGTRCRFQTPALPSSRSHRSANALETQSERLSAPSGQPRPGTLKRTSSPQWGPRWAEAAPKSPSPGEAKHESRGTQASAPHRFPGHSPRVSSPRARCGAARSRWPGCYGTHVRRRQCALRPFRCPCAPRLWPRGGRSGGAGARADVRRAAPGPRRWMWPWSSAEGKRLHCQLSKRAGQGPVSLLAGCARAARSKVITAAHVGFPFYTRRVGKPRSSAGVVRWIKHQGMKSTAESCSRPSPPRGSGTSLTLCRELSSEMFFFCACPALTTP